jgi:REP element-mobilizing transposase RayT
MKRKSHLELDKIYFLTCTVHQWKKLFTPDKYKLIIIESLNNLIKNNFIKIYGYVIMPNHIHLLIKLLKLNGKEKPNASFIKETSHLIIKDLKENHDDVLKKFKVDEHDRVYRVWQRDSLAIEIFNNEMLEQKLEYIHNNPINKKWNLVNERDEYTFSSSKYYYQSINDNMLQLTDYRNEF